MKTSPLISVTSNKGLVRELHGIQFQLERIAEMFELLLNQQNMYIAPQDQKIEKEDEEELMYRDERQAVLQELAEAMRLRKGASKTDDSDE